MLKFMPALIQHLIFLPEIGLDISSFEVRFILTGS